MTQVEVDLELVLEDGSAMSLGCEAVPPVSSSLGSQREDSSSDEGEIEVILDPTFSETPLVTPTRPSSVIFGKSVRFL